MTASLREAEIVVIISAAMKRILIFHDRYFSDLGEYRIRNQRKFHLSCYLQIHFYPK